MAFSHRSQVKVFKKSLTPRLLEPWTLGPPSSPYTHTLPVYRGRTGRLLLRLRLRFGGGRCWDGCCAWRVCGQECGLWSRVWEIRDQRNGFWQSCRPSSVIHQDRTSSDPHYPPNTTEPNPKHLRGTSTHLVEPIINTGERGVGGDGQR